MKTRKIKIDELMALFGSMPIEPVGLHLSDDEFTGYSMEMLTSEEVQRIDQHLASCSVCAAEMDRLMTAAEVWRGQEGKRRLAALRARIQAKWPQYPKARRSSGSLRDRLRDFLTQLQYPNVAPAPAFGTRPQPLRIESEDGTVAIYVEEDEDSGDVIVRIDSRAMELEGTLIRVYAGNWQREVPLQPVASGFVGVEVILTRKERESLPLDAVLQAELVEEPLDAGRARP